MLVNSAVRLAAVGVFGTGTAWPVPLVAAVMALLASWGAWTLLAHATERLRSAPAR